MTNATHMFVKVNNWCFPFFIILVMFPHFVPNKRPKILNINCWRVMVQTCFLNMIITHTNFTKITRVTDWKQNNFIN